MFSEKLSDYIQNNKLFWCFVSVAYASIDWHDFVVVETVDFQPNEIGKDTFYAYPSSLCIL